MHEPLLHVEERSRPEGWAVTAEVETARVILNPPRPRSVVLLSKVVLGRADLDGPPPRRCYVTDRIEALRENFTDDGAELRMSGRRAPRALSLVNEW